MDLPLLRSAVVRLMSVGEERDNELLREFFFITQPLPNYRQWLQQSRAQTVTVRRSAAVRWSFRVQPSGRRLDDRKQKEAGNKFEPN
ncbi:hypothetical protein E2C01_096923 [Portunus trituberculatus]|uniref:Uncharacterized protein n=1 Tax=Portunus trituberculatus TaxID=210409 RepID=A0A5B7K853_PORTR|nr:hypothetical protein [Portunus trituberculatus]